MDINHIPLSSPPTIPLSPLKNIIDNGCCDCCWDCCCGCGCGCGCLAIQSNTYASSRKRFEISLLLSIE
ncbi:hypothetical protein DERP_006597 [Dermatophagoides pteronyssinus]|uniref:Uncharacterized protein n=1 Tax=Dermatophagoides pteronyssinus TaxID=6956 RepID=A0ABQ8IQU0_DERPT|nr:hypothetical protein DERP_006597 [Dermatophagoides pteronyssinus]